jgi:hypothetical protein
VSLSSGSRIYSLYFWECLWGALTTSGATYTGSLLLKSPETILPAGAPDSIIDCSKLCRFPDKFDCPDLPWMDGECTWRRFAIDSKKSGKSLSNQLRPAHSEILRKQVVDELIKLLVENPYMSYVDNTLQHDIGTLVQGHKLRDDGEWCNFTVVYEGPPGYDQDRQLLSALQTSLPVGTTPGKKAPLPSPQITQ